jgi:uncharacterized membrane protein YagU involved in acid resistance
VPRTSRPVSLDIVLGGLAGAAATWAMDGVTSLLLERQPEKITERENRVRDKKFAYEIAADKAASLAGYRLLKKERQRIGEGIHWAIGVSSGAIYGALRNRARYFGIGSGVAYGVVLYLLIDEGALTALALSPPPNEFPWQTHARGLAGHLVLGAVLEAAFDVADLV